MKFRSPISLRVAKRPRKSSNPLLRKRTAMPNFKSTDEEDARKIRLVLADPAGTSGYFIIHEKKGHSTIYILDNFSIGYTLVGLISSSSKAKQFDTWLEAIKYTYGCMRRQGSNSQTYRVLVKPIVEGEVFRWKVGTYEQVRSFLFSKRATLNLSDDIKVGELLSNCPTDQENEEVVTGDVFDEAEKVLDVPVKEKKPEGPQSVVDFLAKYKKRSEQAGVAP